MKKKLFSLMHRSKKACFIFCLVQSLFIYFNLASAGVTIELEAPEVRLGQAFKLILTMDGTTTSQLPDLTPLQKDFSILGTERNMSYSIINGQTHSSNQWVILLTAKRPGVLPIPSLQIGQEHTTATEINVTKAMLVNTKTVADDSDSEVMLMTNLTVSAPYVTQQVIYTVKVYTNQQLLDASYQPPQVDDAIVVPLGTERRYQTTKDGRQYAVNELQYAIFPQKSGELTITPPELNALIYGMPPKHIHLQAKPSVLQVKPKPANFPATQWLAAKQVFLAESYDKQTTQFVEGSTLVRTVTLTAVGVPAQLLPAMDFASAKQFSVYPEKPKEKNSIKQDNLVGTITVKVTYLLNQSGKINIPSLKVTWFNTTTQQIETTALPPLNLQVEPSATPPASQLRNTATQVNSEAEPIKPVATAKDGTLPHFENNHAIAWWFALGFALIWLLTLGLWTRQRWLAKQSGRSVMQQLETACLQNQASKARDALLSWARWQWPQVNFLNLTDVERQVSTTALKQAITQLTQALYQDKEKKSWTGSDLWSAIMAFKTNKKHCDADKQSPLPPIHRM